MTTQRRRQSLGPARLIPVASVKPCLVKTTGCSPNPEWQRREREALVAAPSDDLWRRPTPYFRPCKTYGRERQASWATEEGGRLETVPLEKEPCVLSVPASLATERGVAGEARRSIRPVNSCGGILLEERECADPGTDPNHPPPGERSVDCNRVRNLRTV